MYPDDLHTFLHRVFCVIDRDIVVELACTEVIGPMEHAKQMAHGRLNCDRFMVASSYPVACLGYRWYTQNVSIDYARCPSLGSNAFGQYGGLLDVALDVCVDRSWSCIFGCMAFGGSDTGPCYDCVVFMGEEG